MGSKWEIEKFTGSNDFGLWKVKIEMNDKALSAIILCLADNVLRKVAKERTAAAMWTKLDALYMTKSLAHKQCLKE
ncbi:cytochrome p450, partial [Trifolium pratense]